MKLNRTQGVGIVFMVVAAAFAAMTPGIKVSDGLFEPGARIFPYIAEGIVFFCALLMTITAHDKQNDPNAKESTPYLEKAGWKRLAIASALMIVYALLLGAVGFLIATPIASLAFIYVLSGGNKVNPIVAIIISAVLTIGLNLLFTNVFSIPLPKGLIFRLF